MFKYLVRKLGPSLYSFDAEGGAPPEHSEDWLTSDAIATMACYTPPRLLLFPFLKHVAQQNPHAGDFAVWANSLSEIEVDAEFWPHFKLPVGDHPWDQGTIEPDVLIKLSDGTMVMIEAKFRSPTDAEQLVREMWVGLTEWGMKRFYLLLVTPDLVPPCLGVNREPVHSHIANKVSKVCGPGVAETPVEIGEHILWINWQTIFRVAKAVSDRLSSQNVPPEFVKPLQHLVRDLLAVLEVRELVPFQALAYAELINGRPDIEALEFFAAPLGGHDVSLDLEGIATSRPDLGFVIEHFKELKS